MFSEETQVKIAEARYDDVFKSKQSAQKFHRRYAVLKHMYERDRRAAENEAMEAVDFDINDAMLFGSAGGPADDEDDGGDPAVSRRSNRSRRGSLAAVSNRRRSSSAGTHKFEMLRDALGPRRLGATPIDPKALDIPELKSGEAYLNARVQRSAYYGEVQRLRDGLTSQLKELYAMVHKSGDGLQYIFNDSLQNGGGLLANPKGDFHKMISDLRRDLVTGLRSLRRLGETTVSEVVDKEWKIRPPKDHYKNHGQQTDESLLDMYVSDREKAADKVADEARAESERLRGKTRAMEQMLKETTQAFEARREELEGKLSESIERQVELHGDVRHIHKATHLALNTVYKHRFKFAAACPNTFHSVKDLPSTGARPKDLTVLREAVKEHLTLLEEFRAYFLSDTNFGAKFFGAAAGPDRSTMYPQGTTTENDASSPTAAQLTAAAAAAAGGGGGAGLQRPSPPPLPSSSAGGAPLAPLSSASLPSSPPFAPSPQQPPGSAAAGGGQSLGVVRGGARLETLSPSSNDGIHRPVSANAAAAVAGSQHQQQLLQQQQPAPRASSANRRRSSRSTSLSIPSATAIVSPSSTPTPPLPTTLPPAPGAPQLGVPTQPATMGGAGRSTRSKSLSAPLTAPPPGGPLPAGGGGAAGTIAEGPTRMEDWHRKQSDLWAARRASLGSVPLSCVKLDPAWNDDPCASTTTAPPPLPLRKSPRGETDATDPQQPLSSRSGRRKSMPSGL